MENNEVVRKVIEIEKRLKAIEARICDLENTLRLYASTDTVEEALERWKGLHEKAEERADPPPPRKE